MIWRILISIICLQSLGFSTAHAKELFSFAGTVNLVTNQFNIDVDFDEVSFIRAKGIKTSDHDYAIDVDVEHIKSPLFDFSSQIQGSLAFSASSGKLPSKILGELSSQYSLIDYKPVKELSGRFEIKDHKIFLNSVSFGSMAWSGFLEYVRPYRVDLVVEMDKIGMPSFLDFWAPHNHFDSSGVVSGEIKILGHLNQLQLRGNLQAFDGHIESLRYDNIHLTAAGIYPNIEVSQTVISKTDGLSFIVNGPVNISDGRNFKKQIKALDVSPLVSESASQSEWTIKRFKGQDLGTTEFKYLLRKEEVGVGAANVEESALLGVEQKLEF